MKMELVFKSSLVLLMTAILAASIRNTAAETALVIQLSGVVLILFLCMRLLQPILGFISESVSLFGTSGVFVQPVVKTAMICTASSIGASICKDAGNAAAASTLELIGTASAVYTALPVMQMFVHTLGELL